MLVDLRRNADVFDAVFDNLRDARLFEHRFAAQPTPDARPRNDLKPALGRKSSALRGAHLVGVWAAAEAPTR